MKRAGFLVVLDSRTDPVAVLVDTLENLDTCRCMCNLVQKVYPVPLKRTHSLIGVTVTSERYVLTRSNGLSPSLQQEMLDRLSIFKRT